MRTLVAVLFVSLLAATPAVAQEPQRSRLGAGGTFGFGETWDDEGSIGSGWLAGGYLDYRLFGKTDLEVGVDVLRHERTGSPFYAEGHTTFVSASLLRRFGSDRHNGYLLGGLTIGAHKGSAGFPADGILNTHEGTDWGWIFGGGASFRIGDRLDIGPVIRITLMNVSNDSDPAMVIMTGVRVGFRQ
jgi:hypothetical protein